MEKLEPCPFCGGKGMLADVCTSKTSYHPYQRTYRRVLCTVCGASTKPYGTEKKAVEEWNRRAKSA